MPDASMVAPFGIAIVAGLVLVTAWHLWYSFGLAQIFAANDVPTWRAWVPVLNEAEVFRLGRADPVKVALFFVPVVAVYALVLKFAAVHRIGASYRRGVGTTLLAVLLPPVWAMILSSEQPAADAAALEDDDDMILSVPELAQVIPVPLIQAPLPQPAATVVPTPTPPALVQPAAATVAPPVAAAPPVVQSIPPVEASILPVETSIPASTAASTTPAAAPTAGPAIVHPAPMPAATASRRSRRPEPAPTVDDALERTEVSPRPSAFEIAMPSGAVVPLTARSVMLGRKPDGSDETVQYIAVHDGTRTVSKQHATLRWTDAGWTITDLGSKNGVILVDDDGKEHLLATHASAPIVGRFFLGEAPLELRPRS